MHISGWILPCGTWKTAQEWWHIVTLYDLKDLGHPTLQSQEAHEIFAQGCETKIREFAAQNGFVKIAHQKIDGLFLNKKQLLCLQDLLLHYDIHTEFEILHGTLGFIKTITVYKILKLKNPDALFLFK